MRDRGLILIGLVVFLGLITFPIWYNNAAGTTSAAPVLQKAVKGDACVYPAEYMRANHMDVLIRWRDEVVRRGNRMVTVGGKTYEMSLSKTCLDCHTDKAEFCDKCHDYSAVTPYCWDCHVDRSLAPPVTASVRSPEPAGAGQP
jgi:hypothetical protein